MRNVTNTYILSLALADLLVITTNVPVTSFIFSLESRPWSLLICKISETVKDISTGVSIFTLTALSADRFVAVVYRSKKFSTSSGGKKAMRITITTAIGIWVLAIFCAMPVLIGSHILGIECENCTVCIEICHPFPEHWLNGTYPQLMVMFKFLVLYIIPLIIIFGFYLSMAISLLTSIRNIPGDSQGIRRVIKARKRAAVTMITFVAVFAICFAPSHAFMLYFYFNKNAQDLYTPFWHYVRIVGFCLGCIHSCVNPVGLCFVSHAFRKHFKRYLFCKKPKSNRSSTCRGQRAAPISLNLTERQQSNNRDSIIVLNSGNTNNTQETSLTLRGGGHGNPLIYNRITGERLNRRLETIF